MNETKEVIIEIREPGGICETPGISIGCVGIGDDPAEAREILKAALDALESDREKEVFGNEIVVKS